ncbi:MAG: BlaI/MecI/CopY family transcriptional regulator [Clostridia bacterium]|nr:BlaI/MecI/CopY family transcriptional regulator [Clostridia bacterium]
MTEYHLGGMEEKFADLIWAHAPVPSGELVKITAEELDWKKSTTYTVLRRLCEKGLFVNENGVVRALMNKNEWKSMQSESFVEEAFGGSLPRFLAAFTSRKKLTEDEIEALRTMIEDAGNNPGK